MHAEERRETILKLLRQSAQPVSASTLAGQLSVSRQIIVGDIALLRAGGADILATPRGYCLQNAAAAGLTRRVAVRHDEAGMEAELNTMVDNGCTVVDVIVEHPLYGQLTGPLQLSSRYDVAQFIARSHTAQPLSVLTGGIHLHIGSQIRELHVFENMCHKVNAIVANLEALGFSFRFVDVGGGLGINYDVPENEPIPNFASLFSIVHTHLQVGGREVHFEFGRSIVGECGELITSVLFNKTTATGRKLVIVDASMTELIRPALYGSYHNIENVTSEAETREKYTVVGTACESTDVFDENVTLRTTRRGDLLSIKSAGAYGMSMASRYNLHDLPGAVYSDEL